MLYRALTTRLTVVAALFLGIAQSGSASAANADAPATLAVRVARGEVVAWNAAKKVIAYRGCWLQEGTGEGCSITTKPVNGRPLPEITMWEPGEAEEKSSQESRIATAAEKLMAHLNRGSFVALEAAPWPEGRNEAALSGTTLRVAWAKFRLSVNGPSLAQPVSRAVKHMKEWKPAPIRVFVGPGILVVELEHEPGEGYGEGLNVNHTFEPLLLPVGEGKK